MKTIKVAVLFMALMTVSYRSSADDEIPLPPPLNLPLMAPEAVSDGGTFFSAAHSEGDEAWPPLPFNYLWENSDVQVFSLAQALGKPFGAPFYLIDDRAWSRVQTQAEQERLAMRMLVRAAKGLRLDEPEPDTALRSSGPPPPPPNTNILWLELNDDSFTNGFAMLTLWNTLDSAYGGYQLLLRTNFTVPDEWMLGQIVQGASGTNATDFAPVPLDNNEQMYFRAHYADAIISIYATQPNAYEPNTGFPNQDGSFQLNSSATNDVTVYYRLTGTASNGVDYTNLSGVVTILAGVGYAEVLVQPKPDVFIEGDETVTLTLIPTNTYLIDTNPPSVTVTIHDASTRVRLYDVLNSIEPDPANGVTGREGSFRLERNDDRNEYPALTVYFRVSGTANNGVDYTNLASSLNFPQDENTIYITNQPIADGVFEGDETVTLTLLTTNGYYVEAGYEQRSILIEERATNIFIPVASLSWPIGIDYLAPSNSLIVSYNFISAGSPLNFARIYTNIVSSNSVAVTNTVIADWSQISDVQNEVKLAIVSTNLAGFTNGDMYFGSDTGIGWLSADGTRSNLNWCVLTNATVTNTMLLRGSICWDRTGIFSNQLVCVTSGGQEGDTRDVWRVDAQAHPMLLAQITTTHLEGVITLTNDVAKWGPWAGKIITGDETASPNPIIYAVSPNGTVDSYDTTSLIAGGIFPEDFDIIPPNQDLYACDPSRNMILKLPASYLTNYVGDLLITDAGEVAFPSKLFIVHWDVSTSSFVTHSIQYLKADDVSGQFEHVTFAPIKLQPLQ